MASPPLSISALSALPEVRPGDDLGRLLAGAAPADLDDGDVLVIAHKVVSKAEGRLRRLDTIQPGTRAIALATEHEKDPRVVQAILDESVRVVRAGHGVLVCESPHGFICANAGVDRSNLAEPDELLLLPKDPDSSARALRAALAQATGVRPALVIADSFGRAWRLGQTDVAIGCAGLSVLDEWRGRTDRLGRPLRATAIAVADVVAGAADLARTKSSGQPAVLVRGLERFVTKEDGAGARALRRPPADDLFS